MRRVLRVARGMLMFPAFGLQIMVGSHDAAEVTAARIDRLLRGLRADDR